MNERRKSRPQHKITRILTLVCFFHFSGLNNGFTTLIISAGQIQRMDMAPLLAQNIVATLHPLHCKKIVLDVLRLRVLPRSAKVIALASHRAVQTMLIESSHAQMWLTESLMSGHVFLKVPANSANKDTEKKERDLVPTSFSTIAPERVQVESRTSPGYLKAGKKHAWLVDRTHFWNGNKDADTWLEAGGNRLSLNDLGITGGYVPHRFKRFIRNIPDKLRIWLTSSLSRGGSDLCYLPWVWTPSVPQITLPHRQGDFLFTTLPLYQSTTCTVSP